MKVSCSFFHFLHSNVSDNKCHKQKWCMLFFTCIKLAIHVLVCARAFRDIKWRRLHIIFIYLLALFILQNLNSYSRSSVTRMHHSWAQNGPFAQMRIFPETLLISLVLFIYAKKCQKSMSDINLLMKY